MSALPDELHVPRWQDDALCRDVNPSLFFLESEPEEMGLRRRGKPADYAAAKVICSKCPVIAPCREAGMDEAFGVWGGLDPSDRRRIRRRRYKLK